MKLSETSVALSIKELPKPLAFENCADVAQGLQDILTGWTITQGPICEAPDPLVTFKRDVNGRIRWSSRHLERPATWLKTPPKSCFDAVCDIRYELSDWFLDGHPGYLCLHCAAVKIGDGLVVFPSPARAGKSIVSTQFAMSGFQIFGDDVLPINVDTKLGMSLGIAPRLRLPLPKGNRIDLEKFVRARLGPSGRRHCYIRTSPQENAPYGEVSPIKALVILDRVDFGPVKTTRATPGEMLKHTISRNFSYNQPASKVFSTLQDMVSSIPLLRVRYSRSTDVVKHLSETFA